MLDEKLATGYSLFIVGCSAFVGGVKQVQKGNVDFKTSGLDSYRGVKRRFTYKLKNDSFVFIDDYAHHPKEIDARLRSSIC